MPIKPIHNVTTWHVLQILDKDQGYVSANKIGYALYGDYRANISRTASASHLALGLIRQGYAKRQFDNQREGVYEYAITPAGHDALRVYLSPSGNPTGDKDAAP